MKDITAKTGNAQIKRLGHTKTDRMGRDSRDQVRGPRGVTDERVK